MKITYPADQVQNPIQALRAAGYQYFVDPVTKKESFIIRLTTEYYPRFHLYLKTEEGNVIFDLHLDQKKPSYKGTRAHGGEYDGPTVEREMQRIADWVRHTSGIPAQQRGEQSESELVENEPAPVEPAAEAEEPKKNDLFGGIFS